jgi:hypothetical protein
MGIKKYELDRNFECSRFQANFPKSSSGLGPSLTLNGPDSGPKPLRVQVLCERDFFLNFLQHSFRKIGIHQTF